MRQFVRRTALTLAFVAMSGTIAHAAHLDRSHLDAQSHNCTVCHTAAAADVPTSASAQPLVIDIVFLFVAPALISDTALFASAHPRGPPAA